MQLPLQQSVGPWQGVPILPQAQRPVPAQVPLQHGSPASPLWQPWPASMQQKLQSAPVAASSPLGQAIRGKPLQPPFPVGQLGKQPASAQPRATHRATSGRGTRTHQL